MKRFARPGLVAFAAALAFHAGAVFASEASDSCVRDLDVLPGFMLANDAGGRDLAQRHGQAVLDKAFAAAREQASTVQTDADCVPVLRTYLSAWRKGHLGVRAIAPPAAGAPPRPAPQPAITLLSPDTAAIRLPTFEDALREPLVALLKQHHDALAARRNWVIDVRGNGGGSDSTYQALLPWLLPAGWIEISAQWLVTPANIESQQRACALFSPGDSECQMFMDEAVARMKRGAPGTFVEQEDGDGWRHERPSHVEPRRPQQVAVLFGDKCGSSCEQFLLTVRQGFGVKLVGRGMSAGVLDYSNMRPYDLPSARRRLMYATSRANRLPSFPLDGTGLSPDIFLPGPPPADAMADVDLVRRALEGAPWRSP